MGQSKLVQGHAGSFWHTKEINIDFMNDLLISVLFRSVTVLFYNKVIISMADLHYMRKQIHALNMYVKEQLSQSVYKQCRHQFQFTFRSSGMKTLRAFLIIGCGFSSSSENLRLRGSNISWPGILERARSAGSGS